MDQLQRIRSHRRAVVAGCGVVAIAVGVIGVTEGRAAAATTPEAFAVVAGAPDITTIDLGAPGKTPGDLYVVRSPVFDTGGAEIGELVATQTSIRIENRAETVQVTGTFELPGGSIVIGGLSLYPLDGNGNVAGREFVRPVVGGTGRYAGVGGTVTTVRRADGRYDQRFSLTGVPQPTERVTARGTGGATVIDLGATGRGRGDAIVVTASLRDARDAVIGTLRGVQTIVESDGAVQGVNGSFTYALPGGQIAVLGRADTPPGGGGLVTDEPFPRAVVGGTGDYAGRAGTVVTTRTASGAYDSVFDLQPRQQLTRTLRLIAGRGKVVNVDLGPAGRSAADMAVFGGSVRDRRGRRAGRARGVQTTVVEENGAFTVQANITYDLRGGQIVVGGLSQYPAAGDSRPIRGRRFVRPVLGGTGRYAGTRGTLTTVTRRDGSFRQVFRLTE